ncbi:RHS repeat-associated core domain-containing protein [Serratia odorifera]|uniref:RHS repeat-associated core domain-containing protein n=1 Tax=Serratia odorifera TaxID=618 RepID=UPI00236280A6|nr:RHS repeat-associated core domain-containing protein [Serratia odorifera]
MHSSSHFDPQLGIDIHTYPFGPLPTPHIALVFDVFDYLPLIGTTVNVNGIKRASAGTGGLAVHIPIGGPWLPPLRVPGGPQLDNELFMGSKTVRVDGEPFSRITMPVLSCNFIGMMPPFRPKRLAKPKPLSLMMPLTLNLALPNQVVVGGPPTVNVMALLMRAGLSGLGKGLKKFKKSAGYAKLMTQFQQLRQKLFKNMDPGFLKCKVLRAEPVDIRDGSVALEHRDFVLPGRLPLIWARHYSSADIDDAGYCGYGWTTPADIRLERDDSGVMLLTRPQGITAFGNIPDRPGREHAAIGLPDGGRLWWERQNRQRSWIYEDNDGVSYCFDDGSVMPLASLGDRNGNGWRLVRQQGQLTRLVEYSVQGASGREVHITSERQRITVMRLYDALNGVYSPLARYEYDADNQLAAEIDALGAARRFDYQRRRMTQHQDRNGQRFHYAYDPQWRVIHAWGDGGLYDYQFIYHDLLNEVEVTDSLGYTSHIRFDSSGLPISEIDPLGGNTVFNYDDFGRPLSVTQPDGRRYQWEYDALGLIVAMIQPDGSRVSLAYNDLAQLVALSDAKGAQWFMEHDQRGNLLAQRDPTGVTHRYRYDELGQPIALLAADGERQRCEYDRYGFLQALSSNHGQQLQLRYDLRGNLRVKTDELGQQTRYEYDAKDRLLQVLAADGKRLAIEYDREDQPVCYRDEAGQQILLRYNATGMVTECLTPEGERVAYQYDTEDQLTAVVNPLGQTWCLRRDGLGRVVEERDYWGQATGYQWDGCGRLQRRTDPQGRTLDYGYDRAGRLQEKRSGEALLTRYRYDAIGQLIQCENRWRQLEWRYDAAGRLLAERQDGFTVRHHYNDAGQRILRESDAGHRVAFGWNDAGLLASIGLNDDPAVELVYDATGRLCTERLSAELERQLEYDGDGQLIAQRMLQNEQPLFSTGYRYDRQGNMLERDDSRWGRDRYRYDADGRLLVHIDPAENIRRFVCDAAGNRLALTVRALNDTPEGWFREGWHNDTRYVFDRTGNLRQRRYSDGSRQDFVWDESQQLIAVHQGDSVTHYAYDGLGRRVCKQTPRETHWFYWQGDALLAEVATPAGQGIGPLPLHDVAGRLRRQKIQAALFNRLREYVYYPGSFRPFALLTQQDGQRSSYHYHCDPNGAPLRLTDGGGEVVWSQCCGVWGEPGTVYANKLANPLRFQGQYFDGETGLHYNRYRYYDPQLGGYISQDPIGLVGGVNPYRYAPNPLGWADPWGLKKDDYTISANSAATDIPARGVHVNVHGPGLPAKGGHVSLVPGDIDPKTKAVLNLAVEPADKAADSVSASQWRKIQASIKNYLDDPKNISRLISAAQGGIDLPASSMTADRLKQIKTVKAVLEEHKAKGTNPCR